MANINENILPNFLVIGAAKCGTTSLYHYLKQHPDVYMSPIKEPNYFCTDIRPVNFSHEYKVHEDEKNLNVHKYVRGDMSELHWEAYVDNETDYKLLFKFAEGKKRIGEISNSYLFSKEAAANIHKTLPGVKLIAILRNPASRAFSHYMANLRDGRTTLSFRQEIEADMAKPQKGWGQSHVYVEMGYYTEQVKRFKALFPPDQLLILFFDDLIANPQRVVDQIFDFLGLDKNVKIDLDEKHNEARVPKNAGFIRMLTKTGFKRRIFRLLPQGIQAPVKDMFFRKDVKLKISPEDKAWLTGIYSNDIEQLSKEVNRDLSAWLG